MRKQFLRFYAAMVILLILVAETFFFTVLREFDNGINEDLEHFMTPLLLRAKEKIDPAQNNPETKNEILDSINKVSPFSVHVISRPILALPADSLALIDAGEVVVVKSKSTRTAYLTLSGLEVLAVGPMPMGDTTRTFMLVLTLPIFTVIFLGVMIYLLIRPIERRITTLTDVAKRLGTGALESRAHVGPPGAFEELEETFNWMADHIEQLVTGQKELLRAVSHDLRTPLSRLFFELDDAQMAQTVEEKNAHLSRIDGTLTDMNDLVDELLTYLRLDKIELEPNKGTVDAGAAAKEMVALVQRARPDIVVELRLSGCAVNAEERYFKRALANLMSNAARHAKTSVVLHWEKTPGGVKIMVDDDGAGIPEKNRKKAFEPFYRLDPSRSSNLGGSGLGLAIVSQIMGRHKGTVEISDSPEKGARFTLFFPDQTDST